MRKDKCLDQCLSYVGITDPAIYLVAVVAVLLVIAFGLFVVIGRRGER